MTPTLAWAWPIAIIDTDSGDPRLGLAIRVVQWPSRSLHHRRSFTVRGLPRYAFKSARFIMRHPTWRNFGRVS